MTDLIDRLKRLATKTDANWVEKATQACGEAATALEDAEREKQELYDDLHKTALQFDTAIDRAEAAEAKLGKLLGLAGSLMYAAGGGAGADLDEELCKMTEFFEQNQPVKASGKAPPGWAVWDETKGLFACSRCHGLCGQWEFLVHAPDCPFAQQGEGESQGRCETTLTERFAYPDCRCGTYEGNLGPCKTWEPGENPERCVYCDHALTCHEAILGKSEPDRGGVERHTIYNADQGWCVTGGLGRIACEQKSDACRIATALSEVKRLREALEDFVKRCPDCGGKGIAYTVEDETELGCAPGSSGVDCGGCKVQRAALEASKEPGDG